MTAAIEQQLVTIQDLRRAAEILAPVAIRTPLLYDDVLSEKLGAEIRYKPECLQRAGAFKFRGAYNYLHSLPADVRARGVVAPSSGNHGRWVLRLDRIPCRRAYLAEFPLQSSTQLPPRRRRLG